MTIDLEHVFKKYNKDWIFRNVSLQFEKGRSYAVTGPNGSGKSTLLQIIAGNIVPTKGQVCYCENQKKLDLENIFKYISVAAPYLELPEAFTLDEFLKFHYSFKKLYAEVALQELPGRFNLMGAETKYIKNFSTGMKQRLKLGIALMADTPVVLLDEPATNLDSSGVRWYREEVEKHSKDKLLIISSNREDEFEFCDELIDIVKFKL